MQPNMSEKYQHLEPYPWVGSKRQDKNMEQERKLQKKSIEQKNSSVTAKSNVSSKSVEKDILKKEITFLKEHVKRLKGTKVDEEIKQQNNTDIRLQQLPSHQTLQLHPSVLQPYLQSRSKQSLISQLNPFLEPQTHSKSPSVTFRVGRIVKNCNNAGRNFIGNQSKTIEARRSSSVSQGFGEGGFFGSRELVSRQSSALKRSDLRDSQMFRTIQSRDRVGLSNEEQHNGSIQQQKVENIRKQQLALQLKQVGKTHYSDPHRISQLNKSNIKKKPHTILDFNQTIKSHQLPTQSHILNNPSQTQPHHNTSHLLIVNPDMKIPTKLCNQATIQANPQYTEQPTVQMIRQQNVNIRKISYKLGRSKSKVKRQGQVNIQEKRKQQLLDNFLSMQKSSIKNRYTIIGNNNVYNLSSQPNSNPNHNYLQSKSSLLNSNFKSRLLSKSKLNVLQQQQHVKQKLKGRIIKNFGQHQLETSLITQQDEALTTQVIDSTFSVMNMPKLYQKPHPKSNQEEIIEMTIRHLKKVNIVIKRQQLSGVVIKRFKNCLIFNIPQTNKKVVWYYEGRFYYGEGEKDGEEGWKAGEGIQFIPEKGFYKGQYKDNRKHGEGIMLKVTGEVYEGQWQAGVENGHGKHYNPQLKTTYQGQFLNGKPSGYGILLTSSQTYKGTFFNGLKHGFGHQKFKNGDTYRGEYELNKFYGKGKYTWSNGSFYQGTFIKGIRTGSGKWKSQKKGGDVFIGQYVNDRKHGLGKYCWGDGSMFEGYFENDEKHGEGILTYVDGKSVHGRWQHNKLVEVMSNDREQHEDETNGFYKREHSTQINLTEYTGPQMTKSKLLNNI